MAYLNKRYYYADNYDPEDLAQIYIGFDKFSMNPFFVRFKGRVEIGTSHMKNSQSISSIDKNGIIYLNAKAGLSAPVWEYVMAHGFLHLAFGHFDKEKMPNEEEFYPLAWNKACDIYVTRFLADIGFGKPLFRDPAEEYPIKLNDEVKIYEYILKHEGTAPKQKFGLNAPDVCDMYGLNSPVVYKAGEKNEYLEAFYDAMVCSMKEAVGTAGGYDIKKRKDTNVTRAAEWFLSHYPLLGGLASSFKIIEDVGICQKYEIQIAAVDVVHGEIYANPACEFTFEEWIFVLAHEYLHAGLCHHERCQGRDRYLWNIACDFVINDWLREMRIGEMPSYGLLYDETFHNMSAEAIYDQIVREMRKYKKKSTFRGYGKGDIFSDNGPHFEGMGKGISLDDFFRSALGDGLDYHIVHGRGYLPAGLVEEVRALSMPPIPWEVELGKWFDEQFPPIEKYRTYARPSRRQGATPDIPRPSYTVRNFDIESRTFGVVIDTSGSMSKQQIGLALGAVASYAASKEVSRVRIVFCDAEATDVGYLAPEDIAGRVEITGRGGTVLQPGVDRLEKVKDFPRNGPVLIITDGIIENSLRIKREHAYLIPYGSRLPFRPKGKVFYMDNKNKEAL